MSQGRSRRYQFSGDGGTRDDGLTWRRETYVIRLPNLDVKAITFVEETYTGEARIADQVRRAVEQFTHLKYITVSPNAPEWERKAHHIERKPKGLTSILAYDKKSAHLWYQVTSRNHRATIYVKYI